MSGIILPSGLEEGQLYSVRGEVFHTPESGLIRCSFQEWNAMFISPEEHTDNYPIWLAFGKLAYSQLSPEKVPPFVRIRIPLEGAIVNQNEVSGKQINLSRLLPYSHTPIVSQFIKKWANLLERNLSESDLEQIKNYFTYKEEIAILDEEKSRIEEEIRKKYDLKNSAIHNLNTSKNQITQACLDLTSLL